MNAFQTTTEVSPWDSVYIQIDKQTFPLSDIITEAVRFGDYQPWIKNCQYGIYGYLLITPLQSCMLLKHTLNKPELSLYCSEIIEFDDGIIEQWDESEMSEMSDMSMSDMDINDILLYEPMLSTLE